jgi:hypothetical protein
MVKVTIEELLHACDSFASACADSVQEATREFPYPEHFSQLVWRCALRKSHDYFTTIVELVSSGRSWAALPLLRPMCEDLFYLGYLEKLDKVSADTAVKLWAPREVTEGLSIQTKADDSNGWESKEYKGQEYFESLKQELKSRLKKLNEALGDKGWNKGREKPSAREAAESVEGGNYLYDVLYFGTSKHVHFSPHQLMRMVGCADGKTGSIRRTQIFERLDAAFCLSIAGQLLTLTILTCRNYGFDPSADLLLATRNLIDDLNRFGRVPFIVDFEFALGSLDADPKPQKVKVH